MTWSEWQGELGKQQREVSNSYKGNWVSMTNASVALGKHTKREGRPTGSGLAGRLTNAAGETDGWRLAGWLTNAMGELNKKTKRRGQRMAAWQDSLQIL